MYCIEVSTCDIVGIFRRPRNCALLVPSLRSWPHAESDRDLLSVLGGTPRWLSVDKVT